MFKKLVDLCVCGDWLGICVVGLDVKVFERGLVCESNTVFIFDAVIVSASKIWFFKSVVKCGVKFYIMIGYMMVMVMVYFFGDVLWGGENVFSDVLASM